MKNIISRIIEIEKKILPKSSTDLHNLIIFGWYRDGKPYYKDEDGVEKEFIESEHKRTQLVVFLDRSQGE